MLADPELMASAPPEPLAATAMNALAHAMEALYTPLANPVASIAALRAAELLAEAIAGDPPAASRWRWAPCWPATRRDRPGIAVHHALCQTIVRDGRARRTRRPTR